MANLLQHFSNFLHQQRLERIVRPYTLVGSARIKNLYRLAAETEAHSIEGDFVECGVRDGGTGAILAHIAARSRFNRTVWLFDSFEGMPPTTEQDGDEAVAYIGKDVGSMERVAEVLRLVGANQRQVRIIKGWFQDTFPTIAIPKIAVLNIDADWYESVKLCLEKFYDAVVPGGFISIDDYGHWPGCKQAVDEFFATRNLNITLTAVDYTARWFSKP